jgi:hypothetical protein
MAFTIDELCKRCLDSNAKVSDLLREAKIIAVRRRLQDLQDWADDELTGYVSGRRRPHYRKVVGSLKYSWDGRRNWGELFVENRQMRDIMSTTWLNHTIDELEQQYANASSSGDTFILPFPQEVIRAAAQARIQLPDEIGLGVSDANRVCAGCRGRED